MKKIAAFILTATGFGYLTAIIWELITDNGVLMNPARPVAEPVPHIVFLHILFWCLASIWAGYTLYQAKDD